MEPYWSGDVETERERRLKCGKHLRLASESPRGTPVSRTWEG
jgi:hypothetical protein